VLAFFDPIWISELPLTVAFSAGQEESIMYV
jgi:hypothetical protein